MGIQCVGQADEKRGGTAMSRKKKKKVLYILYMVPDLFLFGLAPKQSKNFNTPT